jgi:hypothetical protein
MIVKFLLIIYYQFHIYNFINLTYIFTFFIYIQNNNTQKQISSILFYNSNTWSNSR